MSDCHHEWTVTESGYACTECEETSAQCVVTDIRRGEHPTGTALLICDVCMDYEMRVLVDIASALGHWRYEKRSLVPAIRYDRDRADMASGEDERPRTFAHPRDVVEVLWSWADMWSEALQIDARGDVTETIRSGLMWAAHHADESGWHDYRQEVRTLRHHARRMAGLLPKRHAGPCVYCGGQIVQDNADEKWEPLRGTAEEVRCTRCRKAWENHKAWMFTNQHTLRLLPEYEPEQLVTIEDAWLVFPDVPKATWRKWRERDDEAIAEDRKMPIRSWDERGRPLYRVGDLDALVKRRADDTRDGPKVTAAGSATV